MIRPHLLFTLFALTSGCAWAAPLSGLSAADVNGPPPLHRPNSPSHRQH